MLVNSRGLALLLAAAIAVVTTAFLSLLDNVKADALLVAFIISFSSGYLLTNVILEFLIFKEINKIYSAMEKIRKKDLSFISSEKNNSLNPLRRINQEIHNYATVKQQEIEDLKRLEVIRREFLADVSHELKTPIFAAQGFVHTLLDGAVKDKSVRMKFLKKAAKSLDGLDALVQDLLTISQMESGQIKMHPRPFDLVEMVSDVFDQLENKAEKRDITLQMSTDVPPEAWVKGDPQRISQVLTNLISNGIKYSGEETVVTVGINVGKKDVSIYVKDNGQGIPPEHIRRIFERFYRVEKSRSRDKGGTGLGLAIVKHIVEAHGSTVSVTSAIGKGCTFSFKLPKVTQASVLADFEEEAEKPLAE
ncbi:sensor histidine kinase [Roseivirga sp. BDSF3-8]|uniref:sensor histidine kinase n=1 Tax=Roseivirga sp. BDSF3-8 TaxID=3241598 RepID=UPI0035319571